MRTSISLDFGDEELAEKIKAVGGFLESIGQIGYSLGHGAGGDFIVISARVEIKLDEREFDSPQSAADKIKEDLVFALRCRAALIETNGDKAAALKLVGINA